MNPLLIPIIMPLILASLMVGEYVLGKVLSTPTHGGRQTLNNLAVTLVYKTYGMAFYVAPFFGYVHIQQRVGLFEWSLDTPLHWAAAWLILDFTQYWRHRAAHRIALLWAVHAVHHQSEEYNTTVAARASMFQETLLVVTPLAALGAPLAMAIPVFAFTSFVTFFSHTQLVGKLGWLDRVFVTPSVHRVHHGRNLPYLDKNYGASLVVWDHLFGTYAAETEPVDFGTLDGLVHFDPLMNNLSPIKTLVHKARQAATPLLGLKVLFMPPGWDSSSQTTPLIRPLVSRKPTSPTQIRYLVATSLLIVGAAVQVVLAMNYGLSTWQFTTVAMMGLSALGISGAVLDLGPAPWHRDTR